MKQLTSVVLLLIGADEEEGSVSCIVNNPNYKEYGFTMDFALVADVAINPENTVIGKRAFGGNPNLVG